jgi:hypothetical protein
MRQRQEDYLIARFVALIINKLRRIRQPKGQRGVI